MPIRFFCPECQAKLTVSRRHAGQRGRCPSCKTKVQVPDILVPELQIASQTESQQAASATKKQSSSDGLSTASRINEAVITADSSSETELIVDSNETAISSRQSKSNPLLEGELTESVSVPRWVVYMQGALLGIIATSFFVFGFAVGNHTKSVSQVRSEPGKCRLAGTVYFDDGTYRTADLGAVIILLPTDRRPQQRPPAQSLRPQSFVPLDNPSIDTIRDLGGSVVRANQDGSFQSELSSPASYWMLVISKNKMAESNEIPKPIRAELGAYFFPLEELLDDRAFRWSKIRVTGETQTLESVVF